MNWTTGYCRKEGCIVSGQSLHLKGCQQAIWSEFKAIYGVTNLLESAETARVTALYSAPIILAVVCFFSCHYQSSVLYEVDIGYICDFR